MCTEKIDVQALKTEREAYEVRSFLKGVKGVEDVQADFITDTVTVTYDENRLTHQEILDHIENSGCVPCENVDGLLDQITSRWIGQKV